MKSNLFRIKCLTNLHVGSGDVNYNIVDKEVQLDPVTGYPIIHTSGVKGAFKDAYTGTTDEKNKIFGQPGNDDKGINGSGDYKFIDAKFLSRPLRVGGNHKYAYVHVTTVCAVNDFIAQTTAFGCNSGNALINISFPEDVDFFVSDESIKNIEGSSKIEILDTTVKNTIQKILGLNDGEAFAVAKDLNSFSLPVIARNSLENGISKNLWYEEFVPYQSRFYLIVLTPDEGFNLDIDKWIQFGGNASVGYGYCKVEEI